MSCCSENNTVDSASSYNILLGRGVQGYTSTSFLIPKLNFLPPAASMALPELLQTALLKSVTENVTFLSITTADHQKTV